MADMHAMVYTYGAWDTLWVSARSVARTMVHHGTPREHTMG